MADGDEEAKSGKQQQVEIQERGEIFFFYRPKVGKEEVHGPQDVQRLYVVLRRLPEQNSPEPTSAGTQKKEELLRLIVMGRKSLPEASERSRRPYWGFVELVTSDMNELKNALGHQEYDTRTRGHREVQPARAVGEGAYRILKHYPGGAKMHTHLVYKLQLPAEDEPHEAQESLHIEREASFLIQIKNPNGSSDESSDHRFGGLGSKQKAVFPARLQGLFGKKRYSPADPTEFLDYEGCELLLIAVSDDVKEELGVEVETELCDSGDESCSDLARLFGDALPTKPLFHGTWL